MKPLTAHQRSALHLAARKGGANLADGKIRRQTANLLALREWVTIVNGVVLITKAGRVVMNAPLPPEPEVYLHKDGMRLTTRLDLAARDEPALMTPPRADWREHSAAIHLASRKDADAARLSGLDPLDGRVAELKRMAAERGKDIRGDLRQLEHVVRRIERKVSDEKAA